MSAFGDSSDFALKRKNYGPVTYHRFDTAAEGIRYAIESLSPSRLKGSVIETGAFPLDAKMIRQPRLVAVIAPPGLMQDKIS